MSRLLSIFRPEQEAIWRQLAHEIDGKFLPHGGKRGAHAVVAKEGEWTVILDTHKKGKKLTKTRIRAPYVNRDSFYFRIYRRQAGSNIRKMVGMQDVLVGEKAFDDAFIIQGNDERKLTMLFSNPRIRQFISWQPEIWLFNNPDESWVVDTWREGISELSFQVPGIITDLSRLHDLYGLFAELLNQLCHIGSAYEDDPFLKH